MALKATKELKVPLYGVRVMIFSTKVAGDKFLGYESIDTNYSAMVSVLQCSKGIDYIAITFRTLEDYCSETLTHECVHAAWRVLELVGIKVSVDNQEPLAYLAGWLSRQVNNFMMNHIDAQQQPKD
ncbi:hypothetical protein KWG64_06140 [Rahnella sp. PD12R]|uniref:hypothetical protein n=1 Tax=Rahnella sp. PD12R TaxID=2855688 RepID=UPI001C471321|nr:hypothetical protein [Rahnella sp. PD12R]MBV6817519.1 hypothetical protein [Rahnella sp. PD12R]